MRHKKLLTVMLAAVMAFSSIGCGGSKPAEGSAPAAESKTEGEQTSESPAGESAQTDGQKVEIRFTWWAIPRETICTMKYATDLRKPIPTSRS